MVRTTRMSSSLECFKSSSDVIGNYKYDEWGKELGKGTYSRVFRGMDKRGSMNVAIKVIYEDVQENTINDTSLREIVALRHLNPHPHIISVKDVVIFPDRLNIVMPLADMTLSEVIRDTHYLDKETNFKSVAYQIIKAVAYCNSMGVMHRDIKPQNILCSRCKDDTFRVMLTDFGLARMNVAVVTGMTNPIYTSLYRPPEIFLECPYDESAEVWATACVVIEMFRKMPLFTEDRPLHQMMGIFGAPTEKTWPMCHRFKGWNAAFNRHEGRKFSINHIKAWGGKSRQAWDLTSLFDLMNASMKMAPPSRCTIYEMQDHAYFDDVRYEIDGSKYYGCPKAERLTGVEKTRKMNVPYPKREDVVLLKPRRRLILFEWMTDMKIYVRLRDPTLFLSVRLCESYLARHADTPIEDIQLISCACMMLASRMYEMSPLDISLMIDCSQDSVTKERLCEETINVLRFFDYNLMVPTAYDHLIAYCKDKRVVPEVQTCAINVLVISLPSLVQCSFPLETVATSCLAIGMRHKGIDPPFELTERIKKCIDEIVKHYDANKDYCKIYRNARSPDHDGVMTTARGMTA